jgi:hypothetical protein
MWPLNLAKKLCELDSQVWSHLCDIDLNKYVNRAKFILCYEIKRAKEILNET